MNFFKDKIYYDLEDDAQEVLTFTRHMRIKNLRWKIAQAAEWRWWIRYLRSKPKAGYLEKKRAYWLRILEHLNSLNIKQGARVLDAGCGPAGIFMVLEQQEVIAVDPLLDIYEQKLPHFSKDAYPWVRFKTEKLESYKSDYTLDFVFCLNAINHVDNIDKALDRLFEALKPGGQLILSVDAHKYQILKKIFQWLPGDILHPHQYDKQEYSEMLEFRAGKITNQICLKPGGIFDYFLIVAEKSMG